MPRLLLTVQYLGTRYAGWQTQTNATGVQQVIERAVSTMFGCEAQVQASGRTDSGVHALAQRAHVDVPREIPPGGVLLGLNDLLPHDIRIVDVVPVGDDFHARFQAKEKTYVYQIWNGAVCDVFHHETFAHVAATVDEMVMSEAAALLVGTHDFRAFTVADPEVSSTTRNLMSLTVRRHGQEVFIEATADGFLRYMVRRIAGLLIEIGRGRIGCSAAATTLEPTFTEARWTAPANGLVLRDVTYADERP